MTWCVKLEKATASVNTPNFDAFHVLKKAVANEWLNETTEVVRGMKCHHGKQRKINYKLGGDAKVKPNISFFYFWWLYLRFKNHKSGEGDLAEQNV